VGFNAGRHTNSTSCYNYYIIIIIIIIIINTLSSKTHIKKINTSNPVVKTDNSELKNKKKLKFFFSFL